MITRQLPKITLIFYNIKLIICVIFLTLGLSTGIKNFKCLIFGHQTYAKIINIYSYDNPLLSFEYTIDGKTYYGEGHNFNNKYKVNDSISIYYLDNTPNNYIIPNRYGFISYLFVLIFLPLVIIYIVKLYKYYSYKLKVLKVIKEGEVTQAKITDVIIKDKDELNGYVPFIIKCQSTSKEYTSKLIYDGPTDPIGIIGYKVNVYYNKSFHFIDVNSLER